MLCCRNEQAGQAVAAELQPTVKVRQGMCTMMNEQGSHLPAPRALTCLRQCTCCRARPTSPCPREPTTCAHPLILPCPGNPGTALQGKITVTKVDLADLASVQEAGRHLAATLPSLDLLVLNAGVSCPSRWEGPVVCLHGGWFACKGPRVLLALEQPLQAVGLERPPRPILTHAATHSNQRR